MLIKYVTLDEADGYQEAQRLEALGPRWAYQWVKTEPIMLDGPIGEERVGTRAFIAHEDGEVNSEEFTGRHAPRDDNEPGVLCRVDGTLRQFRSLAFYDIDGTWTTIP